MSDIHDNSDTGSTCSLEIIFTEPPDFRPATPPPPTFSTHTLLSGEKLTLRLVGHDPLWGHHLWNSGRVIARYLESHKEELVRDREVLELGAGAGLPGLVCAAVGGAKRVCVTLQSFFSHGDGYFSRGWGWWWWWFSEGILEESSDTCD